VCWPASWPNEDVPDLTGRPQLLSAVCCTGCRGCLQPPDAGQQHQAHTPKLSIPWPRSLFYDHAMLMARPMIILYSQLGPDPVGRDDRPGCQVMNAYERRWCEVSTWPLWLLHGNAFLGPLWQCLIMNDLAKRAMMGFEMGSPRLQSARSACANGYIRVFAVTAFFLSSAADSIAL
jgi:hypothetical protein